MGRASNRKWAKRNAEAAALGARSGATSWRVKVITRLRRFLGRRPFQAPPSVFREAIWGDVRTRL